VAGRLASAASDEPEVSPLSAERHKIDPDAYNLDFFAYKEPWCQPPTILATGAGIIAAAYALSGGSAKIAVLAAGPIFAWWYIFLYSVPRSFRQFAVDYMESHDMPPEGIELAGGGQRGATAEQRRE
jgi:hypothetical protein